MSATPDVVIESTFTDDTECGNGWHVVLPSHPICQCDYVTLKQAHHAYRPIKFRLGRYEE